MKLVSAPHDRPFVVVRLGRVSVNRVTSANLVKRGLDNLPYMELRTMNLQTVAERLVSGREIHGVAPLVSPSARRPRER